jgi:HEAT repeat protein
MPRLWILCALVGCAGISWIAWSLLARPGDTGTAHSPEQPAASAPAERPTIETGPVHPGIEDRAESRKTPAEWREILRGSPDAEARREAMRALSTLPQFEQEDYKSFLRALQDKDAGVRVLAVKEVFRRYEGLERELTPLMSLMLEDRDQSVRAVVANRLGFSGDDTAVPALIGALRNRDPAVFSEVHHALLRLTRSEAPKLTQDLTPSMMDASTERWEKWYADNRVRYERLGQAPK